MHIPAPEALDYRLVLRAELSRRQAKNPAYSLRAMARDIKMSPPHLSGILRGSESLSVAAGHAVAAALGYVGDEGKFFASLVKLDRAKTPAEQRSLKAEAMRFVAAKLERHLIRIDEFALIADWHHLALLCAADIKRLGGSVGNLAKAMGLPFTETRRAVRRLVRLGLAKLDDDDVVTPLRSKTGTHPQAPSVAVRNFHKQLFRRAADLLDVYPPEKRFVSSSFIAIPESAVPEMQVALGDLLRQFCEKFEDRGAAEQVYQLSTVLMPVLSTDEKA